MSDADGAVSGSMELGTTGTDDCRFCDGDGCELGLVVAIILLGRFLLLSGLLLLRLFRCCNKDHLFIVLAVFRHSFSVPPLLQD